MGEFAVFVAGMHRSGTSAVAGALARLGVDFGSAAEQIPAGSDNPRGFYERTSIVDLNDRLLEAQGWTWESLPADTPPVQTHWDPFVLEGRNLVSNFSKAKMHGIKDPRCCVTLSYWRRVLLDRFMVIRVLRDPAEVVWSLMVRDGYSATHAAALVKTYDRRLDRDLDGLLTLNIRFEDLVEDPQGVIKTVYSALSTAGAPLDPLDDAQLSEVQAFIDPQLRRASVPRDVERNSLISNCRMAREGGLTRTDAFEPHVKRSAEYEPWESDVLQDRMRFLAISRDLTVAESRISTLEYQVAASQTWMNHLSAERDEVTARNSTLECQITELELQGIESEGRNQAVMEDLTLRLKRRRAEVRQLREDLEFIRASSIWRVGLAVTWPGRLLKRLLRRPSARG